MKYVSRSREYVLELETGLMRLRPQNGSAPMEWTFEQGDGSRVRPERPWGAAVNYYTSAGFTSNQAWGAVRYERLYPGVDLIVYQNNGSWEFDYVVAPGSNPSAIGFHITGARQIQVDSAGDLLATTLDGETVHWRKPQAWQGQQAIAAGFEVNDGHVRLNLGDWDRSKELVIDPSFVFSTYVGGTSGDLTRGIGLDGQGNVYICGGTTSNDLPTKGTSFQPNYKGAGGNGLGDAFLAKFTPAGVISYITYLGGTGDDSCTAMNVDSAGNVVVVGITNSNNFPVTPNAAQKTFGGSGGNQFNSGGDAFAAKFNPSGGLTWATYLGGSADDGASAVTLDGQGNVYVAGVTLSSNFPGASGGFQTHFHGSAHGQVVNGYASWWNSGDAFVAKLDPMGQHILNSTYLGGALDDGATSIALDGNGNVWIGGVTKSGDFPLANAYQKSNHGTSSPPLQPIASFGDGFISEFDAGLTQLLYSTYLGGSQDDGVLSIAVDASGVYAAGFTLSPDFPTVNGSYQTAFHGPRNQPVRSGIGTFLSLGDAFVTKLNPLTNQLVYSTFIGGSDDDVAGAMVVDQSGDVFLAGMTKSTDFPVSGNAMQKALAGRAYFYDGIGDGFLAELDPTGAHLLYSSYLGGDVADAITGLAMDANGTAYVTGGTNSTNFPTTEGLQRTAYNVDGEADAFLSAISMGASASVTSTLPHVADGNGFDTVVLLINTGTTDAAYSVGFFNQSGAAVEYPIDPTQSAMTGVIHAGSEAVIRTTGSGNTTHLGWGQVTAPASVKGMVIYQQQASATSLQEGSAPIAPTSGHFFVPFDNESAITSIGFANPSPTVTASVSLTVRYDTGGTDVVPAFNMNPLQQVAELVSGVWAGTAGKRGLIEVNSTSPLGLVAFRFTGAAFTLIDTIAPTAGSATPITSTIAHTADGNGFRSTFLLTNSGAVAAPYTLSISGPAGQPLTFGFDVASPLSGSVPAGSTLTIDTTGLGNVTQLGWAQLMAAPAVSGIEVFRQTNPHKSEQQATIPISQTNLSHFFLPFDNVGNTTTIAVANPDPATTATVNATIRFADGTSSAGQFMLSPRNYGAETLASLLAATAGKAGVVEFTSNVPVAVVEVRFNPTNAFTSLRAVSP